MYVGLIVKKYWHSFRKIYMQTLYESCLDPIIKEKLIRKMKHHERKLDKIAEKLVSRTNY